MNGLLFLTSLAVALLVALWVGYEAGRHHQHAFNIRRYRRWQEEKIMATLAEILALTQQVKTYVEALKANQADPADQAVKDQIAAELQGMLPPAPPPNP